MVVEVRRTMKGTDVGGLSVCPPLPMFVTSRECDGVGAEVVGRKKGRVEVRRVEPLPLSLCDGVSMTTVLAHKRETPTDSENKQTPQILEVHTPGHVLGLGLGL